MTGLLIGRAQMGWLKPNEPGLGADRLTSLRSPPCATPRSLAGSFFPLNQGEQTAPATIELF